MKFGKEFSSQMVPEWQEAYMNYTSLKIVLKTVLRSREKLASPAASGTTQRREVSLARSFSGLTNRHNSRSSSLKTEEQVIIVSSEQTQGSEGCYQTRFLVPQDDVGVEKLAFFRKLDNEFNKVVKFYKDKVHELMKEAEDLDKQMDALVALRIKVEKPVTPQTGSEMPNRTSCRIPRTISLEPRRTGEGRPRFDVIDEVEMSRKHAAETPRGNTVETDRREDANVFGARHERILSHVKINISTETPIPRLKNILVALKSKMPYSRVDLSNVEGLLRNALIEFYQKLLILKSYCFLNQLAFCKIMKKYDKITSTSASKVYLEMVDNSYLSSSDEITRLMERVESAFIKHFSNGNRKKGMSKLRPQAKRKKHRVTFYSGLFSGCALALLVSLAVLIRVKDVLESEGRGRYMENIFPLYSLFGFVGLHMLMFSWNIYLWRCYRVNYPFIFGFKRGKPLGHRDVFLLSSALAVLSLAAVHSNLEMELDPKTNSFRTLPELVPLCLVAVVLLIVFCPFRILYRSSRFFFLQCLYRCMCAPLYKVTLPDFFLADQFCSQAQALRSLEFYVCYYGWGEFKTRSHQCRESKVFEAFYYCLPMLPYWSRCAQCLRRLYEEKDSIHAVNALKYFSTILALAMRTSFDLKHGLTWNILAAVTSAFATIISTYWDLVVDWGLLNRGSKNPWLRDKLLISNKSVYFVAMVLNTLLRLAWLQSILGIRETSFLHRNALAAIVACLEILRRGIWSFFRLENEHLNNVGKFRAFKTVPLPFSYDHDEEREGEEGS